MTIARTATMPITTAHPGTHPQYGLTLIEVLVTLVILSVGLLGMAAMQFTGIRSANGSSFRTQATLFADDMVERMRANPTAVNDNVFLDVNSATNINCGTAPTTYCADSYNGTAAVDAATCSTTQLANYDINTWYCGVITGGVRRGGVAALLPQASATIRCTDTNADPLNPDTDVCTDTSPHTISISWTEPNPQRNGDATIQQTVAITMQP